MNSVVLLNDFQCNIDGRIMRMVFVKLSIQIVFVSFSDSGGLTNSRNSGKL